MTPFEGGYCHRKLIFSKEFPFKPLSMYMITSIERFECNRRLCLSITDFHHNSWNPAWSVSTMLMGCLSFTVEKDLTVGSRVHKNCCCTKFSIQCSISTCQPSRPPAGLSKPWTLRWSFGRVICQLDLQSLPYNQICTEKCSCKNEWKRNPRGSS